MALNIEDKKAIVAEVAEVAKKAVSAVTADSCGIPVASLTQLRKTIIGLSLEHPGAAARIFKNFAKTCNTFKVKALAFEGKAYSSEDIDVLATLPTYDEAIAQLMATMKEAAAGKLVRTLAALGEKLGSEAGAQQQRIQLGYIFIVNCFFSGIAWLFYRKFKNGFI